MTTHRTPAAGFRSRPALAELDPADVGSLMDAAIEPRGAIAALRGVRLRTITPAVLTVAMEPRRMLRVLGQLVDAAVRASPPGSSVCLSAALDGEVVVVRVVNDACDITADAFARIFEGRIGPQAPSGGRGEVDLHICRLVVEAHHGTLTAQLGQDGGLALETRVPGWSGAARDRATPAHGSV